MKIAKITKGFRQYERKKCEKKMAKLSRQEMIKLNPKTKMVFGKTSKGEGYLSLSNVLDFHNLKLLKGWEIDAKGLTDEKTAYPVFIKEVLVAGPKVCINKKTDSVTIYRP